MVIMEMMMMMCYINTDAYKYFTTLLANLDQLWWPSRRLGLLEADKPDKIDAFWYHFELQPPNQSSPVIYLTVSIKPAIYKFVPAGRFCDGRSSKS